MKLASGTTAACGGSDHLIGVGETALVGQGRRHRLADLGLGVADEARRRTGCPGSAPASRSPRLGCSVGSPPHPTSRVPSRTIEVAATACRVRGVSRWPDASRGGSSAFIRPGPTRRRPKLGAPRWRKVAGVTQAPHLPPTRHSQAPAPRGPQRRDPHRAQAGVDQDPGEDGPGVHRPPEPREVRGAAHGVPGGRLPQHLRVLGGPRGDLPHRRRPVHPALRLLPDRHRQAAAAGPRRAAPRGRVRAEDGPALRHHHRRRPRRPRATAAPGCTPRPCARSTSSTPAPAWRT